MIRKNKPDVIWSTYPIATAQLIGLALHRLTGVPWVVDLRDPMTEEGLPNNPTQKKIFSWIERQIVKRASRIIFTTEGTRNMYVARYPAIDSKTFVVVPNGYDEELFLDAEKDRSNQRAEQGKLTLVHSGVLYPSLRDPTAFFDALSELKQAGLIKVDKLHIILRATGHDNFFQPMLQERSIEDLVSLAQGVGYTEALQEMLNVDGLLLFQAASCNHQVPAKLYEYFRSAKPIFALTDKAGNTADTIREAGLDNIVDLMDKHEIKTGLMDFIGQLEAKTAHVADVDVTMGYSRQALVAGFAKVFDDACDE